MTDLLSIKLARFADGEDQGDVREAFVRVSGSSALSKEEAGHG